MVLTPWQRVSGKFPARCFTPKVTAVQNTAFTLIAVKRICNGVYEEDSFIISAVNIVEAVNRATELLEAVAKEFGAEKWSIWDVGIIEQNVF